MKKWLKIKRQGFTYMELIVSLALVLLVIGPICMSIVTSRKIYSTWETTEKGVYHTEALMEAVKAQLRENSRLKWQKENQLIPDYPNDKVGRSIALYLETSKRDHQLTLEELLSHITKTDLETDYETQRYAYEVGIYPIEIFEEKKQVFNYDEAKVAEAVKFYSDLDFQATLEGQHEVTPIGLSVDFLKTDDHQEQSQGEAVVNKARITLTSEQVAIAQKAHDVSGLEAVPLQGEEIIMQKPTLMKATNGQVEGLSYTITAPPGEKGSGVIEVNVNGLLRWLNTAQKKLEVNEAVESFTLQFINETEGNQTIYIMRTPCEGVDTIEAIDEKIKVNVLNPGHGTINVVRLSEDHREKRFIIVILTRDKKPLMGKKGKIVKKMIDFYSGE